MFRVCILIVLSFNFVVGFSGSNCTFDVQLDQKLVNEGFHRNIIYSVSLCSCENANDFYDNCTVGLDQVLPAGVFANPDELGELRRMEKITAIPKNKVNIELPAEQSQPTSVYIMSKLGDGVAKTWLPVHARYHHANFEGYVRIKIEPPKVYLRCPDQRLDHCEKTSIVKFLCNANSKKKCTWRPIPEPDICNKPLIFYVPVGDTRVYYLVTIITACIIIGGSLHLLKTLHEYKITNKNTF